MLNQNQNQTSFQSHQDDQIQNPYPKPQIKDQNSNIQLNSKYSQGRNYQSQMDYRNSSNRDRSRSNEHSPRQSFHEYRPGNNMKSQNRNNYNMNNRNSKQFYYRQSTDRQFDSNRYKKDRQYGDNDGYNSNYGPTEDDCLIVLPNNYYNYILKDFDKLKNDLKRELKDDIYNISFNYTVSNIPEKIFRFTTNYATDYTFKSKAIKIIADFLFDIMKNKYDNTTYLKLNFLIPDNVIGFIIGISGKNINQIRDETHTKIEVSAPDNTKKYRKVEIAGVPQSIADAGEKIYAIARRYFNFDDEKILNRNEHSPQRERDDWRDNRGRNDGYGMNNYKERDRYYEGNNWNKNYEQGGYNNDKDYKGMYSKERNEYRDFGYKNRDSYKNYPSRDFKKNSRDYMERNSNNYNRDNNNNFIDYRDNGPRFRNNNFDKGNNNRFYYDRNKGRNMNNDKDNEDLKNRDNWSNKSPSRKSVSEKRSEKRSYHDDEWPDEKGYKNEEIKGNMINKDSLEIVDEKDQKENIIENDNIINKNIDINEEYNELKKNLENRNVNEFIDQNNIGVSNIENNNLNNINQINYENVDNEREIGEIREIDDINNILDDDVGENDKACKIILYLSSEEINLLNNSKNNNIWINLETSFKCNISKVTKNIDNQEISLITFNGTLKQNTLAIYQLQKYLLDTKNMQNEVNKPDK